MNADEARRQSLENAKNEIKEIKSRIEKAVKDGETKILFNSILKEGSRKWLSENGYRYDGRFSISW